MLPFEKSDFVAFANAVEAQYPSQPYKNYYEDVFDLIYMDLCSGKIAWTEESAVELVEEYSKKLADKQTHAEENKGWAYVRGGYTAAYFDRNTDDLGAKAYERVSARPLSFKA
jgi:hypothetical protein